MAAPLAICIPTHHGRAERLRHTLGLLEPQLAGEPEVEVCISDNASTDGTDAVVAEFAERVGRERVRYRRNDENLGFARNLAGAVALAEADYCWLLGSDDSPEPTALAEIVQLVGRHPGVAGFTVNRTLRHPADPSYVHHDGPELLPRRPDAEHELTTEHDIVHDLGQLQDFVSTQIVDRRLWNEVVADLGTERLLGQGRSFPHVLIIAQMVRRRPRWVWYPQELIDQRIGSSFFTSDPDYDPVDFELRILRDRRLLWGELYGSYTPLYLTLMQRVTHRHLDWADMLGLKLDSRVDLKMEWRMLREVAPAYRGLPGFWTRILPVLLLPGPLARALRPLIVAARRRFGSDAQRAAL